MTVGMSAELEIHTETGLIGPEWDELAGEADLSPFLRPGWLSAWWSAFGGGQLRILAVRRAGRLVGVLPLRQKGSVLSSPTNWHTPLYEPAVADRPALREVVAGILSLHPRRLDLSFLDGEGAAAQELRGLGGHYRLVERTRWRSPYLAVRGDWEAYWQGVSGNLRHTVRQGSRRLAEMGEVSLEIESGAERLDDLLAEGFEVEARGWKGQRGTAVASDPQTLSFYTEVARWAASRGLLRLAFLRVDGRALAFHFSLESAGKHYLLKPGYDERFRKAGPGTVLTCRMIERAFSLGLDTYEFLGADDEYKMRWASGVHPRVQIQAFATSPTGAIDRNIQTHGRAIARKVMRARA